MELLNYIRGWYGLGYSITFCSWFGKDVIKIVHTDFRTGHKKVCTQIIPDNATDERYISVIGWATEQMCKPEFKSNDIMEC